MVKKKKKKQVADGTCQESCDICKASCAGTPKKCDRYVNHRANGHVCVAHSDEAREIAAAAWMAHCEKWSSR